MRLGRTLCLFLIVTHGAFADGITKAVTAAFRGQLIITKNELRTGKNDKDTIAKIKAARLQTLTGEAQDGINHWNFHYSAFLKTLGATSLKLEFYTAEPKPAFVADKRLDGVDPRSAVLTGDIAISEDDGLKKGKTYTLNLVTPKGAVVATTKLTFK